jgi:hypothetical protein
MTKVASWEKKSVVMVMSGSDFFLGAYGAMSLLLLILRGLAEICLEVSFSESYIKVILFKVKTNSIKILHQ